MTEDLDARLAALCRLDPATEAPPAPGSSRYDSILERAMTIPAPIADAPPTAADPPGDAHRGRTRRRVGLAAAVIVAAAIAIGGVIVLEPGRSATPASATEVLRSAASTTGDVSSLRSSGTYDGGDEPPTSMSSEIDGADYETTFRRSGPDGEEVSTRTVIGTTRWEEADGEITKEESPPEENNAPFPEASEAVVNAALTGSKVTDLGSEEVRGQEATHYRITLTDASIAALTELSPTQLARFELEYPQGVVALDVWVADDLIRRIEVKSDWETGTGSIIEFYDFGADITIRPPS